MQPDDGFVTIRSMQLISCTQQDDHIRDRLVCSENISLTVGSNEQL
jgi:hypothetical protein